MQLLIRNAALDSFGSVPFSRLPKEWPKNTKRHENKRNYNRYICCMGFWFVVVSNIQFTGKIYRRSYGLLFNSFPLYYMNVCVCVFVCFFSFFVSFLVLYCLLCFSCSFSFQNDSIVIE